MMFRRFTTLLLIIATVLVGTISAVRVSQQRQVAQTDGCEEGSILQRLTSLFDRAHAAFFQSLPDPKYQEKDPFKRGLILPACGNFTLAAFTPEEITIQQGDSVTFIAAASDPDGIDSAQITGSTPLPCSMNFPSFPVVSFSDSCATTFSTVGTYGPWTLTVCDTDDNSCVPDTAGPVHVVPLGSTGPSVTKTCPSGVLLPGQTRAFSITFSNPGGNPATLVDSWTGPASFVGDAPLPPGVTRASQVGSSVTWNIASGTSAGSIGLLLNFTAAGLINNSVTITEGSESDAASCQVQVGTGLVQGDIYSSGLISGLTVSGPAVVSSGAGSPNIVALGSGVYRVSNYAPSLTNTWEMILSGNITRLLRERARPLGTNTIASGTFNINPNNRLGGEVWRVSGGLTLNDVDFTGPAGAARGTIIVESGNITINSDVEANNPVAVGLVAANGSITIGPGVTSLRNIYFYAPNGTIVFETSANSLSANGSFIAQSFTFHPRVMTLVYDSNVALNPPPGFISFLLPTILERAP